MASSTLRSTSTRSSSTAIQKIRKLTCAWRRSTAAPVSSSKRWTKATAAAREAVQKMPKDRGLKMVLAAQLADSGEPAKAIAEVRSLLKGDADDREVYIALAQMFSRLRRGPEAEEAAAKALSIS